MEAIVLAGGLGTRLRSIVPELPKPMAPIGDRPFLALLLDYLARQGICRVILSVGYRREIIRSYFGGRFGSLPLAYAVEETPLGTGGAIRLALDKAEEEKIFIVNGDTFLALDYPSLYRNHTTTGADLTMAVRHVNDVTRYGQAVFEDSRLSSLDGNPSVGPGWVNAGVYCVNRNLFSAHALPAHFSFERDFLARQLEAIHALAFPTDAYFIDIGVPDDYRRAQRELEAVARK